MPLILPLEKPALNLRPLLWLLLPLLVLATLFFWPLSLIVEQALRGANGEIGLETFRGGRLETLCRRVAEHVANRLFRHRRLPAAGQRDVADSGVYSFPGSELIGRVVDTFIALPTFLITLAFTFIYGSAGLLNGTLMSLFAFELPPVDFLYSMQGVILAEITVFTPLVMRPLMAALRQIDKSQLEAASILGRTVTGDWAGDFPGGATGADGWWQPVPAVDH